MNQTTIIKQQGLSLVELLIAMVLNIIVVISLLVIFTGSLSSTNKNYDLDIMNNQMQSAIKSMTREIQRAGFWANASADISTNQNNNPFMTPTTDIQTNSANNCILLSYDQNKNGLLPSISSSYDDERYGYRLKNQAIQARPKGATFNCAADASAWKDITDKNVFTTTSLQFSIITTTIPTGQTNDVIQIRSVAISMTGQLVSNSSVTKTITANVKVRNDKYIP